MLRQRHIAACTALRALAFRSSILQRRRNVEDAHHRPFGLRNFGRVEGDAFDEAREDRLEVIELNSSEEDTLK